jgi:hypothetical protein
VRAGGAGLRSLRPAVLLAQPRLDLGDAVAVEARGVDVRQAAALLELDPAWRDAQVVGEALLGDPGLGGGLFAVVFAWRLHWPVAVPAYASRLCASGVQA